LAPLIDLATGQWQSDTAPGGFGDWGKTWLGPHPEPLLLAGGYTSGIGSHINGGGAFRPAVAEKSSPVQFSRALSGSSAGNSRSGAATSSAFVSLSSLAGMIAKAKPAAILAKARNGSAGSDFESSSGVVVADTFSDLAVTNNPVLGLFQHPTARGNADVAKRPKSTGV
jgi:hypothetical protein